MILCRSLLATALLVAGAPLASAKTCNVAIEGNDLMQYNLKEIKVGAESTSVTFRTTKLQKGGDYSFFCSFPGHYVIMQGKFIFG